MMINDKKIGHYQDEHLTLLVQFPLPVLQGALPVMEICWFGNQQISRGWQDIPSKGKYQLNWKIVETAFLSNTTHVDDF
jgi:hypothetical protein